MRAQRAALENSKKVQAKLEVRRRGPSVREDRADASLLFSHLAPHAHLICAPITLPAPLARPIFAPQAAGDEGKIVWGDDLKKTSK